MTHVTQPGAHHSVEICLDVEHNAQKEDRERQEGRGKKESPAGGGREDVPRFRKRLRSIFLLASESDEPASQREIFPSNSNSEERDGNKTQKLALP